MTEKTFSSKIVIPSGVTVEVNENTVKVNGQKGELVKSFINPRLIVKKDSNEISFNFKLFLLKLLSPRIIIVNIISQLL